MPIIVVPPPKKRGRSRMARLVVSNSESSEPYVETCSDHDSSTSKRKRIKRLDDASSTCTSSNAGKKDGKKEPLAKNAFWAKDEYASSITSSNDETLGTLIASSKAAGSKRFLYTMLIPVGEAKADCAGGKSLISTKGAVIKIPCYTMKCERVQVPIRCTYLKLREWCHSVFHVACGDTVSLKGELSTLFTFAYALCALCQCFVFY